jgi:23S rRNA (pseudouridine1915-N3)-methyltransferase
VKYQLLTLGKTRSPYYRAGLADYLERIARYSPIEHQEISAAPLSPEASGPEIQKALATEADRILEKAGETMLVALMPGGKTLTSEAFAAQLQKWQHEGARRIAFVIGSAHGLHERVLKAARLRLSLSGFTLAHELAALVFVEQLFRAHTILNAEPYHK